MDTNDKANIQSMKQAIADYIIKAITEDSDNFKVNMAATFTYCYVELTKLERPTA